MKMFQVVEHPLSGKALDVVVEEHDEGAAERHLRKHGGGFRGRNDADEVGEEDEDEEGSEEVNVPGAMMADDFVLAWSYGSCRSVENVLKAAGTVLRRCVRGG